MNKKLLATLVGSMLVSSIGFAAPVVDLQAGQTTAGYTYSKQDMDVFGVGVGSETIDGFFVQHKLNDKMTIGVEQTKLDFNISELKFTDMTGQYALNDHINLALGARKYTADAGILGSDSETKVLYGINGKTQLNDKMTGYASYMRTSYEDEWRVGANYQLTQSAFVDVNYSHHQTDIGGADVNFKGPGVAVGFLF